MGRSAPHSPAARRPKSASLTSGRAVAAHIALLIWLPGCVTATWWQIGIARGGDDIGWAYAVMWPVFAAYGIFLWWHIVTSDPARVGRRGQRRLAQSGGPDTAEDPSVSQAPEDAAHAEDVIRRAEEEDPALAEYNAYLARLAREGAPKNWRRSGR